MKRILQLAACIVCVFAGAYGVWHFTTVRASETLPTAPVRKGEFLVTVRCRGELKARRTVQITAPLNVPDLRIVWMAPANTPVKAGDVVVRFDPSSAKQQLDEKTAMLRQSEASVKQAEAEARLQLEQDRLEVGDSSLAVEKGKIAVTKADALTKLQGEESRVDLMLAEQKLAVSRAKSNLNSASGDSKIAQARRQRDKAADDVELSKYRLERMEVRAPIDGIVTYQQNFSQGWMNAKPFKVGDQVWPGSVLGEIPDLASLEMEGKVEEIDRGQMTVGHEVRVRVDALPEATFPASIVQLSPLTEMGWEWPPNRSFRGYAKVDKPDSRLRPGMNGRMDVVMRRMPAALSVPANAVFTRGGKPVVYVSRRGAYEPIEIEVEARNADEVAIKGVSEGALVALVEPEHLPS